MVKRLRTVLAGLFGRAPSLPEGAPEVPAGLRVYAIGDIHGERQILEDLLALIGEDMARADLGDMVRADLGDTGRAGRGEGGDGLRPLLVFLGDYVDRGADSAGVLDRLCAGPLPGAGCRFLAGNHEEAMLNFIKDPVVHADWLGFGGAETLASYGIRASVGITDAARCRALRDQLVERLPDRHRSFLTGLESHLVLGDYIFVHAGIRPGRRIERQRRDDLLWIREPFLSSTAKHPKVVVHGHTIVDNPEMSCNRIAIDTGAYATGVLSALVLDGAERRILQSGRRPVVDPPAS